MKKLICAIWQKSVLGGIVFVFLFLPLLSKAKIEDDPYRIRLDFTLRPLVEIAAAPYHF